MIRLYILLILSIFTSPALAQTGDDYAASLDAVEALFQAYPAIDTERPPLSPDVIDVYPISWERAVEVHGQGPNFAGAHNLLSLGCGTMCQGHFMLDPAHGEPIEPLVSTYSAAWREDSRLIIVNDPYELAKYGEEEILPYMVPSCLVFDGKAFEDVECTGLPSPRRRP